MCQGPSNCSLCSPGRPTSRNCPLSLVYMLIYWGFWPDGRPPFPLQVTHLQGFLPGASDTSGLFKGCPQRQWIFIKSFLCAQLCDGSKRRSHSFPDCRELLFLGCHWQISLQSRDPHVSVSGLWYRGLQDGGACQGAEQVCASLRLESGTLLWMLLSVSRQQLGVDLVVL